MEHLPRKALARLTDPETSHQIALDLESSGHVALLECAALFGLSKVGEGTSEETADAVGQGATRYSISPRLKPLREKGYCEKTGTTKKNRSGSSAEVHRLTAKGREFVDSHEGRELFRAYQRKMSAIARRCPHCGEVI